MRILIVSASAGAGHTRAAEALEAAARARHPRAEVLHVDVLDYAGRAYKKAYVGSYLSMVNRAPALWGYLYGATDRVRERSADKFLRFFDRLEFDAFRRFLKELSPDLLLATHFLPAQLLAHARKRGRERFPLGLVVTDFDVHAFWVQETVDRVFVATEELAEVLSGRGIPRARIAATGIPVHPVFAAEPPREEIRERLGLDARVPTVLVMGGGAGVGSMREAVEGVLACAPVQVLAVAGKNAPLKDELERLPRPPGGVLKVFGFVRTIEELMGVADLAVTKSGGLTTSECLALGVPMVVRDPIPGQEERNCDFLLESGAGVRANGPDSLRYKLRSLIADRARLERMRCAARAAGRPHAADRIVEAMLPMIRA